MDFFESTKNEFMTKEPDKQLLEQQTVVLKGIGYTVAVCFGIFSVFIYKI